MQIINGTYLANFVFSIGYFSEVWMVLLVVVVFTVIYRSALHLFFFIVFFLVNIFLNSALKQYVQQERPSGSLKLFASDETFISGRKKVVVYGMPSGHSQKVFFSIAYLLLVLSYSSGVVAIHHHPMFLGLLFTIAALMFVQRLVYRNHTPAQLLVGAAVGITTAYIAYYVVEYASRIT